MTLDDLLTFPGWIALFFAIVLVLAMYSVVVAAIVAAIDHTLARFYVRVRR